MWYVIAVTCMVIISLLSPKYLDKFKEDTFELDLVAEERYNSLAVSYHLPPPSPPPPLPPSFHILLIYINPSHTSYT